jgi:alkanesulfonate monooxygenase
MSLEFHWLLPAGGDATGRRGERDPAAPSPIGPGVSDPRGARFNHFDHLHQIARAAELSGFDGVQIEHDPRGDEAWIIASYLARGTRQLQLVTEFEAAWGSAVYAAKNAATLQRYTGGRQAWFIRAGAAAAERRRAADPVPDEDVHERIAEFLTVARGVLTTAPFSFKGRFFEVLNGGFREGLDTQVVPTVYLTGNTPQAWALSAAQADVHVLDPAPVSEVRASIAALSRLAAGQGRRLRFGLSLELLARETTAEAGAAARGSQRRGQVVGSYEEVVAELAAYRDAGVESFFLSARPHLEEAYRIGAHVLPRLRAGRDRSRPVVNESQPLGVNP